MSGWIYIVRCSDGSFYTGATVNVENRIIKHNSGKGAKYTRSRLPVTLVFSIPLSDYHAAQSIEWYIKQLTHNQKEQLINMSLQKTPVNEIINWIMTETKPKSK